MKSFTLPIMKASELIEALAKILEPVKVVPNPKGTFSHPNKIYRF